MNDNIPASKGMDDKNDNLPSIGEPVWVQCDKFRTMALRDKDGKWRALATQKELVGEIKVIESA